MPRATPRGGRTIKAARPRGIISLTAFLASFQAATVSAQTASENAVTQSSDAFGQQVGSERTGLYNSNEIRGFNPTDSGNVRLETLYFDQVDMLASPLLIGTRIRVGISSQGFAFPAPSGLVDYSLRMPGTMSSFSADFTAQTNSDRMATFEFSTPLGPGLAVGGGVEVAKRVFADGRAWNSVEAAGTFLLRPSRGTELTAFFSTVSQSDNEARPSVVPAGDFLPPRIKRGKDLSQPWADQDSTTRTFGLIGKAPLGKMLFEFGAFHDRKEIRTQFADVLNLVTQDGHVGQRTIVADGGNLEEAFSGEARLGSNFAFRSWESRVTFSIRGRIHDKRFGGAQRLNLGESTLLLPDVRPKPTFALGPKSKDKVKQIFYGASYRGAIGARLRFDGSVARTNYNKKVTTPGGGGDFAADDQRWLWNASAAFDVLPGLTTFVGLIRSMEEAPIAPDRAANRSESPPAINTRQEELGLRYTLGDKLVATVGAFRIAKPYYNLDPTLRYRLLGTVIKQGLEFSAVATMHPGLTLVGGAVFGTPSISGEAVTSGLIGPHPVGEADRRVAVNVDWRLAQGRSAVSFDAGMRSESGRYSNSSNSFRTPGNTTLDIGARYRFRLAGADALLRLRVQNLLNSYAWTVSRGGSFTYSNSRRISLQLAADF